MLNPAFDAFKTLFTTVGLPALGPEERQGIIPEAKLLPRLREMFIEARVADTSRPAITALTLLWHDHLDASHNISQGIESADGSFLHGIMHRREPDYGNAKYWFRRIGSHAAFPEIAKRAMTLPSPGHINSLPALKQGEWDPFDFIDSCQAALNSRDSKWIEYLRKIQQIESEVLLEQFLS